MQLPEEQQNEQARGEVDSALQRMVFEVKRKLKSESKNGLIRICTAMLVDNYVLKLRIAALEEALKPAPQANAIAQEANGGSNE